MLTFSGNKITSPVNSALTTKNWRVRISSEINLTKGGAIHDDQLSQSR
jgi:hypothetical protein